MTNAQMNVRQQIADRIAQKRQTMNPQVMAQSIPKVAVNKDNTALHLLVTGIVCMSLAMLTVGVFGFSGTGGADIPVIASNQSSVVMPFQERNDVNPAYVTHEDASNMMSNVDSRIARLEESVSVWKHRTWMLSVAHNENANIAKVIDQRTHGGKYGSNYITFDRDWRLNRTPTSMDLTDQQKRNLVYDEE